MAILTLGVSFLHRLLDLHPVVNALHIYLQNKMCIVITKEKKRKEEKREEKKIEK
jgi:hypothetical protein